MNDEKPIDRSAYKLTHVVYALHAVSFFLGITLIIAVIINYVKRDDVKGSWLESHYTWQIRGFWYSLLYLLLGGLTYRMGIGAFILGIWALWLIYRIIKGWIYLNDKKPLYPHAAVK